LNLAGVMSGMAILKGWRVAVLVASLFAASRRPPPTSSACCCWPAS
jgi:sec-independent protein translocase protein TatC